MKIVLDTNVLVSGLLQSQGNPGRILTLALAGAVQLCYDKEIFAEYAEVLARARFNFDAQRVSEVLHKIQQDGLVIDGTKVLNLALPDLDDVPFLTVALAASADFLVTGDLAHFPSENCRGCSVVSPAEFMQHWLEVT